jgi:hypothetical protein
MHGNMNVKFVALNYNNLITTHGTENVKFVFNLVSNKLCR